MWRFCAASPLRRHYPVRTENDFLVAGRSLPWPVLVFTLLSSWIGAGSLLGGGENAYQNGFVALWQPAGGWLGLLVIAMIAGRARRFAQFTVPDLLESALQRDRARDGDHRHRHLLHRHRQLPVQRRRRYSALDFSRLPRATGMYIIAGFVIVFTAAAGMASIAYLDLVIGASGDHHRDDRRSADSFRRRRMERGAARAAGRAISRCWATSDCRRRWDF